MILTVVKNRYEREWFDIEVPDDYPIIQLKNLLGMRIYGEPSKDGLQYILEGKFPEGQWFTIIDAQNVAKAGLREGSSIRIQRAYSTTEEEAPIYGRRSLFQNDFNGVNEHLNSEIPE
ncbi:hypothetical protein [Paenibacillus pini]|uniref:Uncharacterized protein n=1 Tax=Paenibacillus pini JCM 16418 TaxID=1236976 RepID=W7YJP5_9BACL|nr:hypothetical protein [Paenibacillus pini]GAF07908.1 hypothetical protein JCM16418_1941 [Paenibacillus pini JCM 16418]